MLFAVAPCGEYEPFGILPKTHNEQQDIAKLTPSDVHTYTSLVENKNNSAEHLLDPKVID